MTEEEIRKAQNDRDCRGYIIRSLFKGWHHQLLTRQLSSAMQSADLIISPDISEHLEYLMGDDPQNPSCPNRYIELVGKGAKAYTAYQDDAVVRLTRRGVDLMQGLFKDEGIPI